MFPEGDTRSAQVQEVLYWQVRRCGAVRMYPYTRM